MGEKGFTLIELVVVLAIAALLLAIVLPFGFNRHGHDELAGGAREIAGALPSWHGPYLKATVVPPDPWGRPYQYRIPGQTGDYDLYTLGADNVASQ